MKKRLDVVGWFFEKVSAELQWRCVGDVPNFPAADFQDFVRKVHSRELALVVDYAAANQLTYVFGMANALFSSFISWIPLLTAACLIVAAVFQGNYWLLCGVPLALLALPFGGVRVPAFIKLGTLTGGLASIAMVWWLFSGRSDTAVVIVGSYVLPFWAIRYWQYRNVRKLVKGALKSEILLLYLLQKNGARIRNVQSGVTFEAVPSAGS